MKADPRWPETRVSFSIHVPCACKCGCQQPTGMGTQPCSTCEAYYNADWHQELIKKALEGK